MYNRGITGFSRESETCISAWLHIMFSPSICGPHLVRRMKQQARCCPLCRPKTHVIDMQVTGSNVESVAESEVMRILILVRNFVEGYKQVIV